MSGPEHPPAHEETGIKDSLGHEIPHHELNRRENEVAEMKELLLENSLVILTAERNGHGKSTFARILRHHLNNQPDTTEPGETNETKFPMCIYQYMAGTPVDYVRPRYHDDYFDTLDRLSYPDLQRFEGVAILDEVYYDQFDLLTTLEESRVIAIMQPNFLINPNESPEDLAEDKLYKKFHARIEDRQVPIFWLPDYKTPEDT